MSTQKVKTKSYKNVIDSKKKLLKIFFIKNVTGGKLVTGGSGGKSMFDLKTVSTCFFFIRVIVFD